MKTIKQHLHKNPTPNQEKSEFIILAIPVNIEANTILFWRVIIWKQSKESLFLQF